MRVQAVAAPAQTEVAFERTLPLGPANVNMQVSASDDDQTITISTTLPGRLVLHWGVEGGRDYRGGWRLPGEPCQPEGTVNYKNRALQTPFRSANGNGLQARAAQGRCACSVAPVASAPAGLPTGCLCQTQLLDTRSAAPPGLRLPARILPLCANISRFCYAARLTRLPPCPHAPCSL